MAMLRHEQVQGQIQGLETGNGRQILEAMFADDTGLLLNADETNWNRATQVISRFEKMSGAKFNVLKSLVVPIGFMEPPSWLIRTGCKIAVEGEVWTYLGCPLGINLSEEQVLQHVLDRITNRLKHWTHRMLSWESRLVLTKHILAALPVYVLMVLGLTGDGYKELTRTCRRFIWGTNREVQDKKALIAWNKMCRRKEDGGLGLISFELQAQALKMRLIEKVLSNEELDWVFLFRAILEWKILDTQSMAADIDVGCPIDHILLLGDKLQLRESPVTGRILEGWWRDLWHSGLLLRDKFWVWRIMFDGLCVNTRMRKMGIGEGMCSRCGMEPETVVHCLVRCPKVNWRWNRLLELMDLTQEEGGLAAKMAEELESAWKDPARTLPYLLLFCCHAKTAWKERCIEHFENKTQRTPVTVLIKQAVDLANEMEAVAAGARRKLAVQQAKAYLTNLQEKEQLDVLKQTFNRQGLMQFSIQETSRNVNDSAREDTQSSSSLEEPPSPACSDQQHWEHQPSFKQDQRDSRVYRTRTSTLRICRQLDSDLTQLHRVGPVL
ncbi:hypothetical protein R1sor_013117 [Riccia sorocarpa]|uniref:Reverse transcriptase zinc-binding domain-containing protein n=1 Tax=Riccia sorocarpa TaxID=122646 RepID=A0ABD3H5L0_9MARC